MDNIICNVCNKSAEFDSPANLCRLHWIEWWVDGLDPPNEEARQELIKSFEIIEQCGLGAFDFSDSE